jgi:hypothetical protein
MKTLTPFTDRLRQQRSVGGFPWLELTLWRDRFGEAPVSLTLRLADHAVAEQPTTPEEP